VVDAYTHRIFGRHAVTDGKPDYEGVRARFEAALTRDPRQLNEFHALVVNTGKNWCRKNAPRCEECPLHGLLPAGSPLASRLLSTQLVEEKKLTPAIPSEPSNLAPVGVQERGIPRIARNDGVHDSSSADNQAVSRPTGALA